MYFYKIGYHTHEESYYQEYSSKNKHTQKELEKIFLDCVKEYLDDNKDKFYLVDDNRELENEDYYDSDKYKNKHGMRTIDSIFYLDGLDTYLEKKGLYKLEYTTNALSYFGWGPLKGTSFDLEKKGINKRLIDVVSEVFEEK